MDFSGHKASRKHLSVWTFIQLLSNRILDCYSHHRPGPRVTGCHFFAQYCRSCSKRRKEDEARRCYLEKFTFFHICSYFISLMIGCCRPSLSMFEDVENSCISANGVERSYLYEPPGWAMGGLFSGGLHCVAGGCMSVLFKILMLFLCSVRAFAIVMIDLTRNHKWSSSFEFEPFQIVFASALFRFPFMLTDFMCFSLRSYLQFVVQRRFVVLYILTYFCIVCGFHLC